MLPSSLLEQPATDGERTTAAAANSATLRSELSGVVLPHHRPVVDLRSGASCGHELLLPDSLRRVVNSESSYSIEDFRLDFALRRDWVLAAQLAGLTAQDKWLLLPVNVSLSARHVDETARLLEETLNGIAGTPISQVRVVIEFEGARLSDQAIRAQPLIDVYRKCGFAIAIKDFGNGFDTRLDLIEAKPDLLRLSPALTESVLDNRHRRSVLSALVGIARELGIDLIADEVNSQAQAEALLAVGVHLQMGAIHGPAAPLALR